MNILDRLNQKTRSARAVLFPALKKFQRIDGPQWAGAFSFHAFFSLFPLMVLLITIASFIVDRDRAGTEVVAYVEQYIPMNGETHRHIVGTLAGVISARGQAGVVAFLILVWVTHRCFTTLICATNRAWGTADYNWWRLPLKSLMLLGTTTGAVLVGMAMPLLMRMTKNWLFPSSDFSSGVYAFAGFLIPLLVVFFSLNLFYRLAPRTPKRFSDVWAASLITAALLQGAQSLFVLYLRNFATFNEVYGAFGGIMALLLWIYFSGCIFVFGACLCAAQAEGRSTPA